MHIIGIHFLKVVVRKSGTVARPDRIDIAKIGFGIQELAGLLLVYPIPGPILVEPFFPKFPLAHSELFGNPPYVFTSISGRHGLAAICTIQAIEGGPNFFIGQGLDLFQIFGLPGFKFCQKTS